MPKKKTKDKEVTTSLIDSHFRIAYSFHNFFSYLKYIYSTLVHTLFIVDFEII